VTVRAVLALVTGVQRKRPLDDVQEQEAAGEDQERCRHSTQIVSGELKDLGQQVEGDKTEQDATGEPEDQMEPIPVAEGEEPTEQRGDDSAEREGENHGRSVATMKTVVTPSLRRWLLKELPEGAASYR
jgi:hypothetical protein